MCKLLSLFGMNMCEYICYLEYWCQEHWQSCEDEDHQSCHSLFPACKHSRDQAFRRQLPLQFPPNDFNKRKQIYNSGSWTSSSLPHPMLRDCLPQREMMTYNRSLDRQTFELWKGRVSHTHRCMHIPDSQKLWLLPWGTSSALLLKAIHMGQRNHSGWHIPRQAHYRCENHQKRNTEKVQVKSCSFLQQDSIINVGQRFIFTSSFPCPHLQLVAIILYLRLTVFPHLGVQHALPQELF